MNRFVGIDIGSTNSKIAVLDENDNLVNTFVSSTGFSSKDTARKLMEEVFTNDVNRNNSKVVATGYGRVSVDDADKTVTEISCHAKGAMYLFKNNNLVIIDIGGQDTKIIEVEDGLVKDFIMNDKCSAGTGRFLDVMARTMEVDIPSLCDMAKLGGGVTISSLCTVFAESEIISLIGRSEKKENIANAVVMSIVQKVASQAKKIDVSRKKVCLTGGLCEMDFIVKSLSKLLDVEVISDKNGKFAGAIGAAIYAKNLK